jgi:hypothetical protein
MKSKSEYHALVSKIIAEHVPFNKVLGLEVESADPAAPRLRFAMRPARGVASTSSPPGAWCAWATASPSPTWN